MILIASPRYPLVNRSDVRVRDLGSERFVLHHLCSTTEEKILRLFDEHHTPCNIVAELWRFENIKTFVQADVGIAIVPRITVRQELHDRTIAHIPVSELAMPRRTLMIYREQGYLSAAALEMIKIVRSFNWGAKVAVKVASSATRGSSAPRVFRLSV
jgi:DNA-binding transcriptional LysR family regulator